MRFRPPVLLLLAVVGFGGAVAMVIQGNKPVVAAPPVSEPAKAPYANFVAGAGLIEPSSENIAIGTQLSGVIVEVPVKSGDRVKAGDLLFRLDDRAAKAALHSAQAEAQAAQSSAEAAMAEVKRLEAPARAEEVATKQALVGVAEALLADAKDQLASLVSVADQRAVPRENIDRKRFAVASSEANLAKTKADLALTASGAWAQDLAVSKAKAEASAVAARTAQARAEAVGVEVARLSVRAPADSQVLRVNVRPGEFAQAFKPISTTDALMVVGDTKTLRVRVDVDENDAWKVKAGAKGIASARGNSDIKAELKFVRIEPLVIPKRSLTGESTERVDTRVLQLVFEFDPKDMPLFVGQQMDVYIEAGAK